LETDDTVTARVMLLDRIAGTMVSMTKKPKNEPGAAQPVNTKR
jgi:hypothetical protein